MFLLKTTVLKFNINNHSTRYSANKIVNKVMNQSRLYRN